MGVDLQGLEQTGILVPLGPFSPLCPERIITLCQGLTASDLQSQGCPAVLDPSLDLLNPSSSLVEFSANFHQGLVGLNEILQGLQDREVPPGFWLRIMTVLNIAGTLFISLFLPLCPLFLPLGGFTA